MLNADTSKFQLWNWIKDLKRYGQVESLVLFCLGFSAGLPYLLVSATLSAWLKEAGLEYSAIGFFAWISLTFSIKFFWAPIIDSVRFPFICKLLGHRRGWLIVAQLGIALGLGAMSVLSPINDIMLLTFAAIFVAFCSATQDISVDAYRIQAVKPEMQGIVTTSYIAGYRVALLAAGAGALLLADSYDWSMSYQAMAGLMLVGIGTVLFMKEPEVQYDIEHENKKAEIWCDKHWPKMPNKLRKVVAWAWSHIIEPFANMLFRYGKFIFLLLAVVLFYRVSDIAMGNMANPFYLALGYSKEEIAWVTKIFGFAMVLVGSAIGGLFIARFSLFKSMLVCLFSVIVTNLLFAGLASYGQDCIDVVENCAPPHLFWLGVVISADNLAAGASNVVFIAFLSSQVSLAYSATQYALLSSIMTLLGKFVSGYSGVVVESVGFPAFFVYVSAWGLPAILLLCALRYWCPFSFHEVPQEPEDDTKSEKSLRPQES